MKIITESTEQVLERLANEMTSGPEMARMGAYEAMDLRRAAAEITRLRTLVEVKDCAIFLLLEWGDFEQRPDVIDIAKAALDKE